MLVTISHDSFRTFCNGLRHAYGNTISNTAVMDAVSDALGWRRDALTHSLKTKRVSLEIGEGFLKTLVSRINSQTDNKLQTSTIQRLFDAFLRSNEPGLVIATPGSEEEWQIYRRTAYLLELRQAASASDHAQQLNDTNHAIRLLKALIGLELDQTGADRSCVAAVRSQPILIHALANISGIEIETPFATLEEEQPWDHIAPIKRIPPVLHEETILVRKKIPGGFGHKYDDNRLFRVIGSLRRPDLKGRAYRAVIDANIPLPSDFKPYLSPPVETKGNALRCLIDGNFFVLMKHHLDAAHSIRTDSYKAFFNVGDDALITQNFRDSKKGFAQTIQNK